MSYHSGSRMQEQTHTEPPVSSGIFHHKYDSSLNNFSIDESTDLNSPGQLFNPASVDTFARSRFSFDFSRLRLHADEVSNPLPSRRTGLTVQRFSRNGAADSAACPTCSDVESTQTSASAEPTTEAAAYTPEAVPTPEPSEPVEETAASEEAARQGLIADDSVTELGPGQMRKSEFLAQLRTEVCRTVQTAIAETGQTTDGCPYIGRWFDFYSRKDSAHVERAIRRYAPEASNTTTARGYISAVTERARQSAETWARTGEITGVPEGIPIGLPGTGLLGGLVSGIGSIFFKARNGGAGKVGNPRAIQVRLGSGQPLDSGVRSRMESAFSMNFSHVRTHTDSVAAGLSHGLNARAFTVGEHVAFGSGEYKPGSIYGDALIAHELAHVIQQSGANTSVAPLQTENTGHNVFEEDADKSAMGAVASLWDGAKGKLTHIAQNAIPRLRSGLRLQRCASASRQRRQTQPTSCPTIASREWRSNVRAAEQMTDISQRRDAMVTLVRQALCPLNIRVEVAGTSSRNQVDPRDYQPYPAINFDIYLNEKQSWPLRRGASTRSLQANYGYSFRSGSTRYSIIGPEAISPSSSAYTRRAADHELYLAEHHLGELQGAQADANAELDTWTHDFINYFHQLGRIEPHQGLYLGTGWQPLLGYYQRASAEARRTALDQIVDYYNNPPMPEDERRRVRETFSGWLSRRDRSQLLVRHLYNRLPLLPSSTTSGP